MLCLILLCMLCLELCMVSHLGDEQNCENVIGKQRLCVEPDLVKVPVKGCVGLHGGLFHWNRP